MRVVFRTKAARPHASGVTGLSLSPQAIQFHQRTTGMRRNLRMYREYKRDMKEIKANKELVGMDKGKWGHKRTGG